MNNSTGDYTARISTATPLRLTLITFELFILNINNAIAFHSDTSKEKNKFVAPAQDFLRELINSLDMKYDISRDLLPLYLYANKLLIDYNFKNDVTLLEDSKEIIQNIMDGFSKLTPYDNENDIIMTNTQSIQAGMTYKNGKLEEYIHSDQSRGFKA